MHFYSFKDFCHVRHSISERKPNIHSQAIRTVCLFYIQTWWHVSSWLQPLLRPVKAWACHRWPLFENEKSECKTVWVQSSSIFSSVITSLHICMKKKKRPLKSISSSIRFFCSGRCVKPVSVEWYSACFSLRRMHWENIHSPAASSLQRQKINFK